MRVLSPDACGATRRHQRIHACAECHGARVLKRPQGMRHIYIYKWPNGEESALHLQRNHVGYKPINLKR